MKRILLGITLALAAAAAYASCVTNTVIGPNGNVTVCTTCCTAAGCTTTCI